MPEDRRRTHERIRQAINPTNTMKSQLAERKQLAERTQQMPPIQLKAGPTVHITTAISDFPSRGPGEGPLEFFPKGAERNPYTDRHMIAIYDMPRLREMTGQTDAGLRQLLKGEALHALTASQDPRWMQVRDIFWKSRTPDQRKSDEGVWSRGRPEKNIPSIRQRMDGWIQEKMRQQHLSRSEAEAMARSVWEEENRKDAYLRAYFGGDAQSQQEWVSSYTSGQRQLLDSIAKDLFDE